MMFFLPAALLFSLGWLIKYKQVTWLISGYNTASKETKQQYDIDKLCNYMGNFLFILASIFFAMAIASLLFSEHVDTIAGFGSGVLMLVTVGGLVYLNTNNRVKK